MTINRKELVKLLVEKTDMSQAEVEAQLDELTNRIMDAAKRGKALEIKGLGLFYFDEKGELCFKVSDQLDSEINFQYAGMEPVELKPSKQTPATASSKKEKEEEETEAETAGEDQEKPKSEPEFEPEPELEDDDVFGIGRTLSGKAGDQDLDDKKDESDDEEQKISDPFKNLFQNPADEIKPQDEKTIKKAGTSTELKSPKTEQPKRAAKKKSRDPIALFIYIFIGLAVLSVGYLIISDYLEAPEPVATETEQAIPLEEPPAAAEPDITDTEEPVDQDEVIDEDVPAEEQVQEQVPVSTPDEDRYGLYGNYIEASGIDFTIVVHSWQTREHANRIADELRQDGYRTIVTEGTVGERVVYRVGIGQFETVQSALSQAELLPEPYRNQNFIHRIQ